MSVPVGGDLLPGMTKMESHGFLRGGLLLLLLALVRVGYEHLPQRRGIMANGESRLEALLGKSQELKEEESQRSRPLSPGERLDPNRATEADLDRLPGVGPATARAIAENREQFGGFNHAEDVLRVPGIGPAKLARMEPFLDFSAGVPMELSRRPSALPGPGRSSTGGDGPVGTSGSAFAGRSTRPDSRTGLVDVNRGSMQELQRLPGIGPALAAKIVESRTVQGPFRVPEDLLRVSGIGEAKLARLRTLIDLGG